METRYLFKQAVQFAYQEGNSNKRKTFVLGAHLVQAEIEKLDHFKLLVKHGLIVEQGLGPAPTQHESLMKSVESHKEQAMAKLEKEVESSEESFKEPSEPSEPSKKRKSKR